MPLGAAHPQVKRSSSSPKLGFPLKILTPALLFTSLTVILILLFYFFPLSEMLLAARRLWRIKWLRLSRCLSGKQPGRTFPRSEILILTPGRRKTPLQMHLFRDTLTFLMPGCSICEGCEKLML